MSCKETQALLDSYLERELDVARTIALQRHLRDCPACEPLHASQVEVRRIIRAVSLRYRAPEYLQKRIQAALGILASE
jgi:anti-sigma factor RsiW